MQKTLSRVALAALALAPLAAVRPAAAQTGDPTRSGTVIENTASVSFTDANNNTYTPATGTASVTVARIYGVESDNPVFGATPVVTSTKGDTSSFAFKFRNVGNNFDPFAVSIGSLGAGVNVIGFALRDSTGAVVHVPYTAANLAGINAYIAGLNPLSGSGRGLDYAGNQGESPTFTTNPWALQLVIYYSVDPGTGGSPKDIPVIITPSGPAGNPKPDTTVATVTPTANYDVAVSGGTASRLRSNGTPAYTNTFTVTNNGNGANSYAFGATYSTNVSGSVTGGTCGASPVALAAGASCTVTVSYSVATAAAVGSGTEYVRLGVTGSASSGTADDDAADYAITVIAPAVQVTKEALFASIRNASGPATELTDTATAGVIPAGGPRPDEYVWYRITVTNPSGATAAPARGVTLNDVLPAQLLFRGVVLDDPNTGVTTDDWTVTTSPAVGANGTVSLQLPAAYEIQPGQTRRIWIRAQIK